MLRITARPVLALVSGSGISDTILLPFIERLSIPQVDLERTLARCDEAEVEIQELEDELKVVGQNMKTLELSETDALARQEKYEETIRTLSCNLKVKLDGG